MIDLRNIFIRPAWFCNPTIPEWIVKIPIINLTPSEKIEVPVKIKRITWSQYMFIFLIFNLI